MKIFITVCSFKSPINSGFFYDLNFSFYIRRGSQVYSFFDLWFGLDATNMDRMQRHEAESNLSGRRIVLNSVFN